jgi:serine phosphatase RsbU (regulator of sigma subunit)
VDLEAGASVVLYTDGLVERRGTPLRERLARLTRILEGQHERTAEELCDLLIADLDGVVEDDVALLVLRAHPEDAPRPPEAGPEVLPADLRSDAAA